jgi:transcriptional regulator of arginine metabolism
MQKAERQNLILDLVAAKPISRQDEIARELKNAGLSVTQASISRDLDELGVVKIDGRYAQVELGKPEASPFGISKIGTSGDNLLVVKCMSGLASAAAVKIDAAAISEIVGTLAGDDTIFVAVADAHAQRSVMKKLRLLFANA